MIIKVQELTESFIEALMSVDFTMLPNSDFFNFKRFPMGCCGDTCDLLQLFLSNNDIMTTYVAQLKSKSQGSHAWLEYEDYIIDPTIGQFKEFDGVKVKITKRKVWHYKAYGIPHVIRENTYMKSYNKFSTSRLDVLYKIIIQNIK